ncbi:MAG: phosphate acyltransferase PlsX [Verrucomicrobiaceae bacterium]|nr:MAG: phosphate acyltransferase PlsX [Verrucomicrobiaceae bacterium]
MKIALDAMGGDFAPGNMLAGARMALADFPRITKLYLVGDTAILRAEMEKAGLRDSRAEIVHASEVVAMTDSAVKSIRQKKDSSIAVATDLVKRGDAQAVVSAGHTGAAVAAATLKLRTLEGVERAGILSPFPNLHGTCGLIDAGANVDSRAIHLVQHAIMGHVFSKAVYQVPDPIVGLMSNGEEEGKGNAVSQEVFERLKEVRGLNFKGNVEGRDVLNMPLHVAVCDGFTGNILLKGCEGTAKALLTVLKEQLTASLSRKILAGMLKPALKAAASKLSYESYGGSPLLGVNGAVVIAHGSSSPLAMRNALRVATEMLQHSVNPLIERMIAGQP